jgi:hypothetical protein
MKQNMLRLLSCSLILLLVLSCKKQKGELSDFPRGRFNFVFSYTINGLDNSVNGEVSGPYQTGGNYEFHIRPQVHLEYSTIRLASYDNIFRISLLSSDITANVTSKDHDSDNLNIQFQSGDTLSGSFILTRIE